MQPITFITNMGINNLEYTKLLLDSLKINLDNKDHQIIVFIDADNEGSLDYLLNIKKDFDDLCIIKNNLDIPIGYQRNKTILTQHAKHDIVSYLQSDMVIGPHYDTGILKHVKRGRILSSTRVEPPLHGQSPVTVTRNLGLHPSEFDMNSWNIFSNSVKHDKLINYFFAPITYYKDDWMALDGYDTIFRRAREDSDFVQRCLHANLELVQTFSANVYHFTCVTSRGSNWFDPNNTEAQIRLQTQRHADSVEMRRFIRKWGNFNHGEEKLVKLDTDLVVKNYDLHYVAGIEPFFHRVWLASEEDRTTLISEYERAHTIANSLLNITDDQWDINKHLYRLENFDEVFHVGVPDNYAVKITIDFAQFDPHSEFLNNLHNLPQLLSENEPGEYELGNVQISIRKIKSVPTPIRADNPPIGEELLTIY